MQIFQILSIFTTIFVIMATMPAHANPYQIDNVKVDVEGESALDAREKALPQARRSAFEVLAKRMIDADMRAGMPIADDQTIASMVDSFEINREKLSKNRYLASVNVTFNERAVQGYLGRYTTMALPDTTMTNNQVPLPTTGQPQQQVIAENSAYNSNPVDYQAAPQQGSLNAYQMRINLNGIYEWVTIQNQLRAINGIKLLKVDALNAKFAVVTVSYAGDGAQLQNDLNTRGMQLYSNTNASTMGSAPYILVKRG